MSEGAGGDKPLISRDQMHGRVEHAIATEKSLLRLGWLVLAMKAEEKPSDRA